MMCGNHDWATGGLMLFNSQSRSTSRVSTQRKTGQLRIVGDTLRSNEAQGGTISMADSEATDFCRQAQQALTASPIHAMHELRIERENDTMILSGRVDTFYHKQLAQEIVRAVIHGQPLVNSIRVNYEIARDDWSGTDV